jgi:hypothetical protein
MLVFSFFTRFDWPTAHRSASHQTSVLAARVQLRHGHPHLLAVDADEDLDDPFVPYLAVIGLAPHANFDLGVVGHVDGSLWSS